MFMLTLLSGGTTVYQYSKELVNLSPYLARSGSGEGELSNLHGFTIDQDGFLYVCDSSNIQVFRTYQHPVNSFLGLINLMSTFTHDHHGNSLCSWSSINVHTHIVLYFAVQYIPQNHVRCTTCIAKQQSEN